MQESIDTTTNGRRLIFHIFGALPEFERNLIREPTQAGLVAARARGMHWRAAEIVECEKAGAVISAL